MELLEVRSNPEAYLPSLLNWNSTDMIGVSGFQTSSKLLAAQNFTMPALSPTMTEGNIASWKVKEGTNVLRMGYGLTIAFAVLLQPK